LTLRAVDNGRRPENAIPGLPFTITILGALEWYFFYAAGLLQPREFDVLSGEL
jgi:hypothetical protein